MTPPPTQSAAASAHHARETVDSVTIRFAGDSGDGMQLVGTEFTRASAVAGNDLKTFPDYPAEIRAPAGTVAGVSGFQIQFSSHEVFTPGDRPDVLVAMNPAALKANLPDLAKGGIIVANLNAFSPTNIEKAGYKANPLEDGSLEGYRVHAVEIARLTAGALEGLGLSTKDVERTKNMFALGLMLWMYGRPVEPSLRFIEAKFGSKPQYKEANDRALKAGFAYGESTELFAHVYEVAHAPIAPGKYRNVSGNEATALGIIAAVKLSGQRGFLGSYPITPASDILHELSKHPNYGFTTFQAEDEIAGICTAIGAAYGGVLAFTTTSGPGMALKQEALGLAVMAELPLVVVNVQRGGPSTGLPTKTEQADLFQAVWGRNGESPVPVIAAKSPADCFDAVIEATRIAVRYMTPVVLLTDGYIGNGQEPWRIPDAKSLEPLRVEYRTRPENFSPYQRDSETLARPWVKPGTPGLEHRIGGLEKDFVTGAVSYDGGNHDKMIRTRAEKVERIARDFPALETYGDKSGDLLVVGWGGTYGAITEAVKRLRAKGKKVSSLHLRHINPLPLDLEPVLKSFKRVVVPEINLGQLATVLRAKFLVDAKSINKMEGKPFKAADLADQIERYL